ncbi:MAG TPA: ATP-dependent DNA helicase RecQ [Puia sp.]|nr:ATP-dependent DNA helicase RecQ [Puia sp.]
MIKTPIEILKKYWGFDAFRPLQEEIIQTVLSGKDALGLLPAGSGKSVCFQLPVLKNEGLCLVISPLVALMKEQVENLRRKGITAFALHSGLSRPELENLMRVASESNCRFLYLSPERLGSKLFQEWLPALPVSLIAVDEAHCISQWGYDFRPPYLKIGNLREELPGVPILALTASATPEVQVDICRKLAIPEANIFRQPFTSGSLSFRVIRTESKFEKIRELLFSVPGSAIVYCRNRVSTRRIAAYLVGQGISAGVYHAGLGSEEREEIQDSWRRNEARVMVCTNAFGMGIDKGDLRQVIHADLPDSLENYYQEAGRAGRDGSVAHATLLYAEPDLETLKQLPGVAYPSVAHLSQIYQAAMNYLQVAAGSGEGNYYSFDAADFAKKFHFQVPDVIRSLKALEQEQLLAFYEQVYLPAQAVFIVSKEVLYEFDQEYPRLGRLADFLLRNYPGIFDQPAQINERIIANSLSIDVASVMADLGQLQTFQIIRYIPAKNTPQLFMVCDRLRAEAFRIDEENWQKRKNACEKRVSAFLHYINTDQCRSMQIASYFGDTELVPCGCCDNCVRNNAKSQNRFEKAKKKTTN